MRPTDSIEKKLLCVSSVKNSTLPKLEIRNLWGTLVPNHLTKRMLTAPKKMRPIFFTFFSQICSLFVQYMILTNYICIDIVKTVTFFCCELFFIKTHIRFVWKKLTEFFKPWNNRTLRKHDSIYRIACPVVSLIKFHQFSYNVLRNFMGERTVSI